jgi:hypothetical protein
MAEADAFAGRVLAPVPEPDMKPATALLALAVVGNLAAAGPALAQLSADDIKWINQCIADNKNEPGATEAIVRKYCMCMNEKMDDNETLSITQWEKKNPRARAACDKEAGWR